MRPTGGPAHCETEALSPSLLGEGFQWKAVGCFPREAKEH